MENKAIEEDHAHVAPLSRKFLMCHEKPRYFGGDQ